MDPDALCEEYLGDESYAECPLGHRGCPCRGYKRRKFFAEWGGPIAIGTIFGLLFVFALYNNLPQFD